MGTPQTISNFRLPREYQVVVNGILTTTETPYLLLKMTKIFDTAWVKQYHNIKFRLFIHNFWHNTQYLIRKLEKGKTNDTKRACRFFFKVA